MKATDSSQPLPVGLEDPLLGILPAHGCDTPISKCNACGRDRDKHERVR